MAAAVGYATVMDTIENQVNAYVDGSTLTSTSGTVSITATETAIVTASALGGSASVSGASGPAVAAAGAGASVSNTLANTVLAYANNATIKTLTSGDVMLEVQDSTTGIAKAAAASLSGSFSPVAAVAPSIGVGLASNGFSETDKAYSTGSTINSAGGVIVKAQNVSNAEAESLAAAASIALGPGASFAGAGANSDNTVNNDVEAYIEGE